MENIKKHVGNRIRTHRLKLGLSQEEFSELIGFHRTYISPLEQGKKNPSLTTLYRISFKLGIPLEELVREGIDE